MPDVAKLIEEGRPVYVVNRSAKILGKSHLLVLTFPNPTGGRPTTVKIPPIKYPINLSRRVAPPEAILSSPDFVSWRNHGVLEVVDPDDAQETLSDPEVRAAIKTAYSRIDRKRGAALREEPKFRVRHGGARETRAYADLEESGLTVSDFMNRQPGTLDVEEINRQEALEITGAASDIGAKVKQFCADLIEDPSLKADYLSALRSWDEDELKDTELGFMMDQLGGGEFEAIISYVRSVMAARAGASAPKKSKGQKRRGPKKATKTATNSSDKDTSVDDDPDEW